MAEVLIIAFLIILNAFFVLCETSLIAVKRSKLEGKTAKGSKNAKIALQLKDNPDLFLSTTQIYITLIAILTGVYSGKKFGIYLAPYLEDLGISPLISASLALIIIVIIVTFFSILFGELVPKKISIIRPESISLVVARPIRLLGKLSYPLVWLLSYINAFIFKILNIQPSTENQVTEEEIKAMINEGSESGTIEEEEKDIIERVFHLGDRNITSLMTHRTDIIAFEIDESKESCRKKIEDSFHSVYPVCRESIDDIVGVIHVKDLYLHPNEPISVLMRKPLFVPENNSAYQVLDKIKDTRINHAFVVDEYGSLLGMITARDILRAIVGEMPEEEDDDYEIFERRDGSYLVDGQIQFYDFLTYFNKTAWIDENEDEFEFDTLAGFILNELERIPAEGDKFEWRGFRFEIIGMDGQRIARVIVHISDEIRKEMEVENEED